MYKYVYEILQELNVQRPSSRQRSSRCFSSHDHKETINSLIPKEKRLKSYLLTKLNKIQADKQLLRSQKQKALHFYKMILDKMVSPLIEYLPSVTTSQHLSRLTDFRTNEEFSEQSEETHKNVVVARPKCVEEPLPILIKPEYKVLKSCKKSWKIINKLAKTKESKNEMINKYKVWKNKVEKDPEVKKSFGKKQGLLVYELFLKDAIESKIEDLMPNIKTKNEHSNVYDLRLQNELEIEECESPLMTHHEEGIASSNNLNSNLSKSLDHHETVKPKPSSTKTTDKTDMISVKTKPRDTLSMKKKEEQVQEVLKVKPVVQSKEESQVKPTTQRSVHKQNWGKSDNNRMKLVKPETAKEKPAMKKTGILSKTKKHENIQPTKSNTLSVENKAHNISGQNFEEKEAEKEVTNSYFAKAENLSEVLNEKNSGSGLLPEGTLKGNEIKKSDMNVTENSEKQLDMPAKENRITDSAGTYAGGKVEPTMVISLDKSDTLTDLKTNNSIIQEPKKVSGNSTFQSDIKFAHRGDLKKNEGQNENQTIMLKRVNEDVKNVSKCELVDNTTAKNSPSIANKSEEEKILTSDNNLLKQTYLVSFEVKDDEGFFKTRSQVISDEIKGDLIDFETVLKEEKKLRERQRRELLSEPPKSTSDKTNLFLNSESDSKIQSIENLPNSADQREENKKFNIPSAMSQDVSTEPLSTNLSNSKNINYFRSNPDIYTNVQDLKINNISEDKSGKNTRDTVPKSRTVEASKANVNKSGKAQVMSEGTDISGKSSGLKKEPFKTQSLELIGREKKENMLKYNKTDTGKETNIFSSSPDKKMKVINKTKEFDKSEKYQEIINSVKKIIPSNSSESILGRNSDKVVLTGAKIKSNINVTKNYTKTINELKDIINGLPGSDNQKEIVGSKFNHSKERENITKNTTAPKTAEEGNTVSKPESLDTKPTNTTTSNKQKHINLKAVKVVDKITNVNEELGPTSTEKNNIAVNLIAEKENFVTLLKQSTSSTSINKNSVTNSKSDSHVVQKELSGENISNLGIRADGTNHLKHKSSSSHLDKTEETIHSNKESIYPEAAHKTKSNSNIKLNERKPEGTKTSTRLDSASKSNKSVELKTHPTMTGPTDTILTTRDKSAGNDTRNIPKDQSFPKLKEEKIVKSAETENYSATEKEKGSSYSSKHIDSKMLFKEENSKDSNKIIRAKSDLNMNKTDAYKIKRPKRTITPAESNERRGKEKYLSITGMETLPQKNKVEVTGEKQNKIIDQTKPATLNKSDSPTFDSTEIINAGNKASPNENKKPRFTVGKMVKSAKTSIENQKKLKFPRLGETVHKKNTKNAKDLKNSEKKNLQLNNRPNTTENQSGVKTTDIQQIESQKPTKMSLLNDVQVKNKDTVLKVNKNAQLTGLLAKKTQKIKIISYEKPKRTAESSKLSGNKNTLPKVSEQRKVQVNNGDTKNQEQLKVNKRMESR